MDEPHKAYPLAHGHPRHNRHSKPKPSPLLPIFNCLNGLVRSDPPFCYCHTEVEGNKCQFSTTSLPSMPPKPSGGCGIHRTASLPFPLGRGRFRRGNLGHTNLLSEEEHNSSMGCVRMSLFFVFPFLRGFRG